MRLPAGHTVSITRLEYAPETSSLRQHVDKRVARRRLPCVPSALPPVKEYPTIAGSSRKVSSLKPRSINRATYTSTVAPSTLIRIYSRISKHQGDNLCAAMQCCHVKWLRAFPTVIPRCWKCTQRKAEQNANSICISIVRRSAKMASDVLQNGKPEDSSGTPPSSRTRVVTSCSIALQCFSSAHINVTIGVSFLRIAA